MKKMINVLLLVVVTAGFSLAVVGCETHGEHPESEHPSSDHSSSDHPSSEHPKK